jgi:hypothetical protein
MQLDKTRLNWFNPIRADPIWFDLIRFDPTTLVSLVSLVLLVLLVLPASQLPVMI